MSLRAYNADLGDTGKLAAYSTRSGCGRELMVLPGTLAGAIAGFLSKVCAVDRARFSARPTAIRPTSPSTSESVMQRINSSKPKSGLNPYRHTNKSH